MRPETRKVIAAAVLVCAVAAGVFAQKRKPIDKTGFFEAVRLKGLSTEEMIQIVRDFGVDFQVTAEDEKQLANLGAERRLIDAVRENYRAAEPPPPAKETAAPPPPAAPVAISDGPPLSRDQLLLVLQAGVARETVTRLIEKRGVSFAVNRQIAAEILAAGGDNQIVGLTASMQQDAAGPAKAAQPGPVPAQPAAAAAPPGPVRVAAAEQAKKLVRRTAPEYPPMAARMRITGVVRLEALIRTGGAVQRLRVLSGHPMLTSAATDAVKSWTYQPTIMNGAPVEVLTEVELNFTLRQP